MEKRLLGIIATLGVFGWLGLTAIEWQFGLGRFARSPQEFLVAPGGRVIVGGGRAVLSFVTMRHERARIELKCAQETRRLEVPRSQASDEVCGVTLRWFKTLDTYRAGPQRLRFEVSWDE